MVKTGWCKSRRCYCLEDPLQNPFLFTFFVIFKTYMKRTDCYTETQFFLTEKTEMEFKEFEPRFKSAKTRFKLSAGINLETFDPILSGPNHI